MGDTETPTFGRKGRKSEVITIRLDPRLKYLAELAARRQRRPLSSYVEWAIEESLQRVYLSYDPQGEPRSVADDAGALWDVDDSDRFANLAFRYPELLTHEEQIVWKLIRECEVLWIGKYAGQPEKWTWKVRDSTLLRDRLRENWSVFGKVARGEAPATAIPVYDEHGSYYVVEEPKKSLDDEIPF